MKVTEKTIDIIQDIMKELAGTNDYNKIEMEISSKCKGMWKFIGYGIPYSKANLGYKKYKDNEYILAGDNRYLLRSEIKQRIEEKSRRCQLKGDK